MNQLKGEKIFIVEYCDNTTTFFSFSLLKVSEFRGQIKLTGKSSMTMKDLGTFIHPLPALLRNDRLSSFQLGHNIRNRLSNIISKKGKL